MSKLDDRGRDNALLGVDFLAGESQDPAVSAARVITTQALSIFEATEEMASEIEARGRRQAEELAGEGAEALQRTLTRYHRMSRHLDALSAELERKAEDRVAKRGHHV